jgi:hypothetical protein
MAGFEFGEKLVVLKKVSIGATKYNPGDEFDYEVLDMDFVEKLLNQRILIRKALVTPKLMSQLGAIKVAKIIKNVKGVRMAISWPFDEDLPEGVLDYRFSKNDQPPSIPEDRIEKQEPPAKKRKATPRRRAKTTLKKDFE